MTQPILTLENVAYAYQGARGKAQVIRKANGDFHAGKVYAITGRSGAGKSTLLTLLSGMDLPTGGAVKFQGRPLTEMDRDAYRRQHIGMIFQQFHLIAHLTALENVMLSLELSGATGKEAKDQAMHLLQKVGLTEAHARQRATRLSGGEQQRVAIARAMAPNPPLILADEPTGNLDAETEQAIVRLLLDAAHKDGRCVVIVTHSQDVARQCDEVWAVKDGALLPVRVAVS